MRKDNLSQIPSLSTSIYFCLTMHLADVNQLAGQIEPFGDGSQEKANAGGIWNPNSYVATCRDEIIGRMVSRTDTRTRKKMKKSAVASESEALELCI